MPTDSDNDIYASDDAQLEESQAHNDEINEDEDSAPPTITQMITETIAACPSSFLKFRVTNPDIVAKVQKKKDAKAKKKNGATAEPVSKPSTSKKRKDRDVDDDEKNNEVQEKRKKVDAEDNSDVESDSPGKKRRKGNGKAKVKHLDEDPESIEVTAYIYVERPIPSAPARTASSSRVHKPTDEEKYLARGLITFTASTPYFSFLLSLSAQLPCTVKSLVQEKITWKFQVPQKSPYLALGGEVGFASMIKQNSTRKPGTRIIMLAMPPPTKPAVEKPFWPIDGDENDEEKTFDFTELEPIVTHDHVVEQRISFDKSVEPHKLALLERYPENNHPEFPNKRIYTNKAMNAHFELTDLKLSVWASHLARGTATVEKPPISSHFDFKSRILPKVTARPPVEPVPVPAYPQTLPTTSQNTSSTSLVDILLINMIQQQQQQQLHLPVPPAYTPPVIFPPSTVAPAVQAPSVFSAPQSPAKFQLPNVTLMAFCERYNINATDQQRLEKLEFQPGDKIDNLPDDDWKTFAGFTSLSWRRIVDKNGIFLRDARNGLWV